MQRLMVISSDGHATARMDDYESYLDPGFREEFRAFCAAYRQRGSHTFEERALSQRLGPYLVDEWRETVIDPEILAPSADRIGPQPEVVLTPPAEDPFPRGDVHKPLGGASIG